MTTSRSVQNGARGDGLTLGERFRTIFPNAEKPLIAMAHLPALPGAPLYGAAEGVQGLIRHVREEVAVLVDAGFDAVMFCNENDRPYVLKADLVSAAVMARVASESAPTEVPFGIDFLWDPECALAAAVAAEASFIREVVTGAWESDMGLWTPDAAGLLRRRRLARCRSDRNLHERHAGVRLDDRQPITGGSGALGRRVEPARCDPRIWSDGWGGAGGEHAR